MQEKATPVPLIQMAFQQGQQPLRPFVKGPSGRRPSGRQHATPESGANRRENPADILADRLPASAWHFLNPSLGLAMGFVLLGEQVADDRSGRDPADCTGDCPRHPACPG